MSEGRPIEVRLPDELLDEIVQLVAEVVVERLREEQAPRSRWMTTEEAAEYARCDRQRIYDLRSERRLTTYRDGRRVLVDRDELDALINGGKGLGR